MGTRDKRVDAYIAQSADFAKPILTYIRDVVHEGSPEEEESSDEATGQLGWLTKPPDLPSTRKLVAYVKKAKELNEKGIKAAKPTIKPKPPVEASNWKYM